MWGWGAASSGSAGVWGGGGVWRGGTMHALAYSRISFSVFCLRDNGEPKRDNFFWEGGGQRARKPFG